MTLEDYGRSKRHYFRCSLRAQDSARSDQIFTDLENMMKKEGATAQTFKLETQGEAATITFLETLGCSYVEKVLLLLQ
jgi:hypothetical protein